MPAAPKTIIGKVGGSGTSGISGGGGAADMSKLIAWPLVRPNENVPSGILFAASVPAKVMLSLRLSKFPETASCDTTRTPPDGPKVENVNCSTFDDVADTMENDPLLLKSVNADVKSPETANEAKSAGLPLKRDREVPVLGPTVSNLLPN